MKAEKENEEAKFESRKDNILKNHENILKNVKIEAENNEQKLKEHFRTENLKSEEIQDQLKIDNEMLISANEKQLVLTKEIQKQRIDQINNLHRE